MLSTVGERNIKLRPASPFIPVSDAISREVHRQTYMKANGDVKINISDSPFSSIGKLTLMSGFRCVLWVCRLYRLFLVKQRNTSLGYLPKRGQIN